MSSPCHGQTATSRHLPFLRWNLIRPRTRKRLRQWCPSWSDAEDAVQDGLVRIWRKRKQLDENSIVLLFTAVKRSGLDRARSQERRRQREQRLVEEQAHDEGATWFEYDAESRERAEHIERSLGIPANTAASRYRYALEALRRVLDAGGWRDG